MQKTNIYQVDNFQIGKARNTNNGNPSFKICLIVFSLMFFLFRPTDYKAQKFFFNIPLITAFCLVIKKTSGWSLSALVSTQHSNQNLTLGWLAPHIWPLNTPATISWHPCRFLGSLQEFPLSAPETSDWESPPQGSPLDLIFWKGERKRNQKIFQILQWIPIYE